MPRDKDPGKWGSSKRTVLSSLVMMTVTYTVMVVAPGSYTYDNIAERDTNAHPCTHKCLHEYL